MSDDYQRVLAQLTDLHRRIGNMVRPVTVEEAKDGRVRPNFGKDSEGKDQLGPWLHTGNHRGGSREGREYKKGQNLMMISPSGDPAQATLVPYAKNNDFQQPDHASEDGKDEETYQKDDLRVKKTKNGYAIWLQEPAQKDDKGGEDSSKSDGDNRVGDTSGGAQTGDKMTGQKKREAQKPDGRVVIRLHNDGGVEARVKDGNTISRYVVSKEGVKMKIGEHFAVITKDSHIVSRPWTIATDPMQDKDETDV
jgi:hypothetical protein